MSIERHILLRSRNTSCKPLKNILTGQKRVIYRMGSTTPTDEITKRNVDIEINTADACKISGNKILMKQAFDAWNENNPENIIPHSQWEKLSNYDKENPSEFFRVENMPMIIKRYNSSKGNGIFFIQNINELNEFVDSHTNTIDKFIIERYHMFSKEYRLHITNDGCFYSCRKMLRNDAEDRWHRHESNSVWILETNELFDKPSNWEDIVQACISAKNAIGLDIVAVDVKVQTSRHRNPKFIILETNSAPALGEVGLAKYHEKLKNIINE